MKITYSPDTLLREQSLKKLAWEDFQFIRDFINKLDMVNKKEVLNVQPHSIDAEQAVLGSMLTDKDAVNKAFEKKLSSSIFIKNLIL